jgi:glycosyltransferase involved in cell wall biosynthesis
MRTAVPPSVKREFEGHPNVRIIDRVISRAALEDEFTSADIFVYPTHTMTPWSVFLEAMSYGLPIVTTDLYANPEIVQDGVTGLLVEPPSRVPYFWERSLLSMGSPLHARFMEAIKTPDPAFVARLAEKLSFLIDNAELRREMGRRAKYEVEEGKHSVRLRNDALKVIFDNAIAD